MERRGDPFKNKFGSHVLLAPEQLIPYPAQAAYLRIEDLPPLEDRAAEVDEDGPSVHHDDVRGLDVAVDESFGGEDRERDREVPDEGVRGVDRKVARDGRSPFHREPRVAVPLAGFEPAGHASGNRLAAEERGLGLEVADGGPDGRALVDLDCDEVARPWAAVREIRGGGAAVAELPDQAVRADVRPFREVE